MKRAVFLFMLALVFIPAVPVGLSASAPPPAPIYFPLRFGPGERLTYEVTLNDANVGKAVLEIVEKTKFAGRDAYHIVSRIKSNKWISLFSRIDDRVESYIDVEDGYSHRIQINKRRKKKEELKTIDFDQVEHRAIESKGDKHEVFDIPPKVQDFLSSLYYLRAHNRLEPGASVFFDLHQNGKNWQLEVRVLEKERVSTPAGSFRTIKVQTSFPEGGLLKSEGDLFIWLTDDEKRVPVMMQSEGKRGLMIASLSSEREGEVNMVAEEF